MVHLVHLHRAKEKLFVQDHHGRERDAGPNQFGQAFARHLVVGLQSVHRLGHDDIGEQQFLRLTKKTGWRAEPAPAGRRPGAG